MALKTVKTTQKLITDGDTLVVDMYLITRD